MASIHFMLTGHCLEHVVGIFSFLPRDNLRQSHPTFQRRTLGKQQLTQFGPKPLHEKGLKLQDIRVGKIPECQLLVPAILKDAFIMV